MQKLANLKPRNVTPKTRCNSGTEGDRGGGAGGKSGVNPQDGGEAGDAAT